MERPLTSVDIPGKKMRNPKAIRNNSEAVISNNICHTIDILIVLYFMN